MRWAQRDIGGSNETFQRHQRGEGTRYERETLRLMMVTDETRLSIYIPLSLADIGPGNSFVTGYFDWGLISLDD